MSIEKAAVSGATGEAERQRMTAADREEQRTNLLAMAVWYEAKGDKVRAAECRAKAGAE